MIIMLQVIGDAVTILLHIPWSKSSKSGWFSGYFGKGTLFHFNTHMCYSGVFISESSV